MDASTILWFFISIIIIGLTYLAGLRAAESENMAWSVLVICLALCGLVTVCQATESGKQERQELLHKAGSS